MNKILLNSVSLCIGLHSHSEIRICVLFTVNHQMATHSPAVRQGTHISVSLILCEQKKGLLVFIRCTWVFLNAVFFCVYELVNLILGDGVKTLTMSYNILHLKLKTVCTIVPI